MFPYDNIVKANDGLILFCVESLENRLLLHHSALFNATHL